jgi:hypothetical protein
LLIEERDNKFRGRTRIGSPDPAMGRAWCCAAFRLWQDT